MASRSTSERRILKASTDCRASRRPVDLVKKPGPPPSTDASSQPHRVPCSEPVPGFHSRREPVRLQASLVPASDVADPDRHFLPVFPVGSATNRSLGRAKRLAGGVSAAERVLNWHKSRDVGKNWCTCPPITSKVLCSAREVCRQIPRNWQSLPVFSGHDSQGTRVACLRCFDPRLR